MDNIYTDSKAYFSHIGSFPLLTAEEEKDLAIKAMNGDTSAKEDLINHNLRLVVKIAKRYNGLGLDTMDLIQYGNMGLITAVDKFDPTLGFRFSTYAFNWIKQGITRGLADNGRTVRLPANVVESVNKVKMVSRALTVELGRDPMESEIAEAMGVSTDKIHNILMVSQTTSSLDIKAGEDGDNTIGDLIEDTNAVNPVNSAEHMAMKEAIENVLSTITEREAEVIRLRFGLKDGVAHTLEDVSKVMGVSRERIRQIESKAMFKLRNPNRSEQLADFIS